MLKHTFYAVGVGLFVFILYLLQYTGAFKDVTLGVDQREEFQVIYKDYMGPYHKMVSTIEDVEAWAKKNGLKCRLSYGEYIDDPKVVEEGRLRARGGCLIDPLVPEEKQKAESLKANLPEGFKLATVPATKAVVAIFSGAPGIGPMKVYPKADEFVKKNSLKRKGSVIEIYEVFDRKSMQTTYVWPIE